MDIDPIFEARLKRIFEGYLILDYDPVGRHLLIQTACWMIGHDKLQSIKDRGLTLYAIMSEGSGCITLIIDKEMIIDKETSKKAIKH